MEDQAAFYGQTKRVIDDLLQQTDLHAEHILVVGVSTSEVIGKKIGTAGAQHVAADIFQALQEARKAHGFHLAFQCCEHLNRALVVEKQTLKQFQLEEVAVIPAPQAGGAMAAYAFQQLKNPVMVEHVKADAGIDIGDTLIGMHLKHVAVPVRGQQKRIGEANVTMAKTRPKLIGGARAIYVVDKA